MSMARMRMEVRAIRRTHPPLQEAHRRQTLQVRRLRKVLRPVRSPSPSHEASPTQNGEMNPSTRRLGLRRFIKEMGTSRKEKLMFSKRVGLESVVRYITD